MPATTAVKRVKNKRIERPFTWPLDETNRKRDTPADHTKGWRVYVRTPEGQPDITRWLKKVQFKIFHTYSNPQRVVESPPFEIEETGWGGFQVDVRFYFAPEANAKPDYRQHFLQLEPYGDEAMQARQKEEKLVRSEFLEYVEFNEPPEALWDLLTDEAQFSGGKKSARGKGKAAGKGKGGSKQASYGGAAKEEGDEDNSVELPEASTRTNPFSKELEAQIVETLMKAEKEVDTQLELEKQREKEAHGKLVELQQELAKG